jgi:hypothetical protein
MCLDSDDECDESGDESLSGTIMKPIADSNVEGSLDGIRLGSSDCMRLGSSDGKRLGSSDGNRLGSLDAKRLGLSIGKRLCSSNGNADSNDEGSLDGKRLGSSDGKRLGSSDGIRLGWPNKPNTDIEPFAASQQTPVTSEPINLSVVATLETIYASSEDSNCFLGPSVS